MKSLCSVMKRIRSSASSTMASLSSPSSLIVSTSGILLLVHLARELTASSILAISRLISSARSLQKRFICADAPVVSILLDRAMATATSVTARINAPMMLRSISFLLIDVKNAFLFCMFRSRCYSV